jgi:hypothetical protein
LDDIRLLAMNATKIIFIITIIIAIMIQFVRYTMNNGFLYYY